MPPWLPLLRATLTANRRQRAVQVATACPERGPTVRTVILRRVGDDGSLVFFTDARSEKMGQLEHDPRLEVHGWWPKGRCQFRLRGTGRVLDPEDRLRQQIWEQLSEEDLARFFGPAPGSPLEPGSATERLDGIPSSFLVVSVQPQRVDVLRLDPGGHRRERHVLDPELGWQTEQVTP